MPIHPAVCDCPTCGQPLQVRTLYCPACDVRLEGQFELSPLAALPAEAQSFVLTFLAARGNIRLVERELGISYPTVRSRLRAVQERLGLPDLGAGPDEPEPDVRDVLARLEAGEISPRQAVDELGK